ncbi:hypothetical protein [Burkholderia plantarii]|uniref:hypothetical protein n=1 Tax=Burkholderia plantarii TaxID=41899 RepID=UPI00272D6635|nr:hypothetical protein [Burkholderia plantarii]
MPTGPWRAGVAVASRRRPPRVEHAGFERREAARIAAEAPRSGLRRQQHRRAGQHRAARVIEIVEMMVVAQQHRVERADPLDRQGRPRGLREPNGRFPVEPGLVDGRIGQQPHAVEFDQHGRAADQRQGGVRSRHHKSRSAIEAPC